MCWRSLPEPICWAAWTPASSSVLTINGHDYDQIESAIKAFHAENDKPTCIILDTVKGTGVSFMTNSVDWHGKGPNDEEYAVAMQELNAAYAALEQEDK